MHSEVFNTIFTQKQRADKSLIALNKTLVAGLALLMFGFQLYGVEPIKSDSVKVKKQNFFYFTASLPMLSGYFIFNYEREFFLGDAGTINLGIGFGGWSNWNNAGNAGLLTTNFITGKGRHHFESNIGLMYHKDRTDFVKIKPVQLYIGAGYRIQQRGKPFLFRTGIGWPYYFYAGFGFAF